MKRVFISHCSDDTGIMDLVMQSVKTVFEPEYELFCTYQKGIRAGKDRGPEIRRRLEDCDYMIAVITNSYLRSVICLAELSAMWAKGGKLIPIVFNGTEGKELLQKLFGEDMIVIDAEKPDAGSALAEDISSLFGIPAERAALAAEWLKGTQNDPDHPSNGHAPRAFIGSGSSYEGFIGYCLRSGVRRIMDSVLEDKEWIDHLTGKKDIYIIGTSSKGVIKSKSPLWAKLLAAGSDIYVLIANQDSDFCCDVARIESYPSRSTDGDSVERFREREKNELRRLNTEFTSVAEELVSIADEAARQCGGGRMGHLYFGDAFTLVRQTVTVGIDPDSNSLWAWLTVTMPPKRASNGTMSFEIDAAADDLDDSYRTLAENIRDYVQEIRALAEQRGSLTEILPGGALPKAFPRQLPYYMQKMRAEWEQTYQQAKQQTELHRVLHPAQVLIEIAAQHPLKDGNTPGTAFRMRLDAGIRLYQELCAAGKTCKIYVPGSLHKGDDVSLSSAGISYLQQSGAVSPEDILPELINTSVKGADGVYNSADECFTAAKLYLNGAFGELHCVCSANQMLRKTLFYWHFGVIPMMHAVPDDSFHDSLYEIFEGVPGVLLDDHGWQDPASYHFRRTRAERMPGFQEKT